MNSIADLFICGPTVVGGGSFRQEIKLTAKSSKRFRLQFNGVNNVEAQVDGKPLDLAQQIPAGNCTIVVTASAAPGAAAP